MRERTVLGDAPPTGPDDHTELGLVVEVVDLARPDHVIEWPANGGRQLGEEDRPGRDVVAELLRVLRVVPASTDDLAGPRNRWAEDVERIRRGGAACDEVGERVERRSRRRAEGGAGQDRCRVRAVGDRDRDAAHGTEHVVEPVRALALDQGRERGGAVAQGADSHATTSG
jgi:hypothetical protein